MQYRIIRTCGNMNDLEKRVRDFASAEKGWECNGGPFRCESSLEWCQALSRRDPPPLEVGEIALREPKRNGKPLRG
jgi:hypothetical protein